MEEENMDEPNRPPEEILLDVMTWFRFLDPENEVAAAKLTALEVEDQLDHAKAAKALKRFALEKACRMHVELLNGGPTIIDEPKISENDRLEAVKLTEQLKVMESSEATFEIEMKALMTEKLPNLLKVHTAQPESLGITRQEKEAKKLDKKCQTLAHLLLSLCTQVDLDKDTRDFIDHLCESVLSAKYDFVHNE